MKRLFRFFLRVTRLSSAYESSLELVRWARLVFHGAFTFRETGATPAEAYQSLILLHCRSRGRSNDFFHQVVRLTRRPYRVPRAQGLLGTVGRSEAKAFASAIRENGYFIFPQTLSTETIDALTDFARTVTALPRPAPAQGPASVLYDSRVKLAPRYDFAEEDLMKAPTIQQMVSDPTLLALAQEYLGCAPVLDIVTMWWSAAFQKTPCDDAGQRFHFDMDRIKWLKFFFYLTDVTPQSGPTCFITGSHRTLGQPKELLQRGYARIADEDMRRHYADQAFVELTCKKGTIVAIDTRGFHKGKPLLEGERLVLQLEFADSLFGATYEVSRVKLRPGSALAEFAQSYPKVLSKFDLQF